MLFCQEGCPFCVIQSKWIIFLGIFGGGVPSGSPNPDPLPDQTSKIHTRFQTWPLGRNYVINTQIKAQTKNFFKYISNSHISLSFSFGIETKIRSYAPVVPSKTIPDFRSKWAKGIPIFRPKRQKNPTRWGGTSYTREYPPPLPGS